MSDGQKIHSKNQNVKNIEFTSSCMYLVDQYPINNSQKISARSGTGNRKIVSLVQIQKNICDKIYTRSIVFFLLSLLKKYYLEPNIMFSLKQKHKKLPKKEGKNNLLKCIQSIPVLNKKTFFVKPLVA